MIIMSENQSLFTGDFCLVEFCMQKASFFFLLPKMRAASHIFWRRGEGKKSIVRVRQRGEVIDWRGGMEG